MQAFQATLSSRQPVCGRGLQPGTAGQCRLLLVVAAYLGVGAVVAGELTLPKRQFYPEAAGSPRARRTRTCAFLPAGDGVEIAGWYAPRAGATRAIIIVHGKDQSRATEFFDIFPNGRFTEMAGWRCKPPASPC